MQLENVMTTEEQEAVRSLIAAHLTEQVAKLNLLEAKGERAEAARSLTGLVFRQDDNDRLVGTIPERFVVDFGNELYFVKIDLDGDNAHEIFPIAGILS